MTARPIVVSTTTSIGEAATGDDERARPAPAGHGGLGLVGIVDITRICRVLLDSRQRRSHLLIGSHWPAARAAAARRRHADGDPVRPAGQWDTGNSCVIQARHTTTPRSSGVSRRETP